MDLMKAASAKKVGPGGTKCACCQPGYGHVPSKELKTLLRRNARAKLKAALVREAVAEAA